MDLSEVVNPMIPFLRERERTRQELFDVIIKPVFEGAEQATKEYMELFVTADKMISDGVDMREVFETLKRNRKRYLIERTTLISLVQVSFERVKDEKVNKFIKTVLDHLFPEGSQGDFFIKVLESRRDDQYNSFIFRFVSGRCDNLQKSWGRVSEIYAGLAHEYALPTGIAKKG